MVPVESRHDPYWELTARIYLESAVSYVLEALPEGERHLGSVVRLAGEMGRDGRYRALMRELEVVDPGSFALSRYRLFQSVSESAEKTAACIFSFLASKLAPFSFGSAAGIFNNPERINFKELGRKKTAVFLTISDTDDSMYRLASLFYTEETGALDNIRGRDIGEFDFYISDGHIHLSFDTYDLYGTSYGGDPPVEVELPAELRAEWR